MLIPLHGLASRHDLPLAFSLVVLGAAAALALSFVLLIFAWRTARFTPTPGRTLVGLSRIWNTPAVRWIARLAVLALYLVLIAALFVGQDLLTNPVFGFVYVLVWVGLVPISLLLGPIWRALNPLRTVHDLLTRAARLDPDVGLLTLPRGVGVWPAAVGIFGYAWLELVQPDRATLPVLRVWALAWLLGGIVGAVVFGRRWVAAADPFEAYATGIAQLSWLRSSRADDGTTRLSAVNPLRNLSGWSAPPGAAGLVSVLLGSTAFDSFANTSWWIRTIQSVDVSSTLFATLGLLVMILLVFGSFCLACWAMRPWTSVQRGAELPRLMAPSVVPIVIGYAIAHYFTLLVVQTQQTLINLSDPFGRGWNLFGTAGLGVNAGIYDRAELVAFIQLGSIVAGHVLGIIVAHERSMQVLRRGGTVAGQIPMLVLMIGYTCAGLVLLFSP